MDSTEQHDQNTESQEEKDSKYDQPCLDILGDLNGSKNETFELEDNSAVNIELE